MKRKQSYKKPLALAISILWIIVIAFSAALALAACSTLPKGWDTSSPIVVSAVVDSLNDVASQPDIYLSSQSDAMTLINSSASIGAEVYLNTSGTKLSKEQRLAEATGASKQFADKYYADALRGRTLPRTVKDVLTVRPTEHIPTDAEIMQALIIYGVRRK